jgi:hypothetical protein
MQKTNPAVVRGLVMYHERPSPRREIIHPSVVKREKKEEEREEGEAEI